MSEKLKERTQGQENDFQAKEYAKILSYDEKEKSFGVEVPSIKSFLYRQNYYSNFIENPELISNAILLAISEFLDPNDLQSKDISEKFVNRMSERNLFGYTYSRAIKLKVTAKDFKRELNFTI